MQGSLFLFKKLLRPLPWWKCSLGKRETFNPIAQTGCGDGSQQGILPSRQDPGHCTETGDSPSFLLKPDLMCKGCGREGLQWALPGTELLQTMQEKQWWVLDCAPFFKVIIVLNTSDGGERTLSSLEHPDPCTHVPAAVLLVVWGGIYIYFTSFVLKQRALCNPFITNYSNSYLKQERSQLTNENRVPKHSLHLDHKMVCSGTAWTLFSRMWIWRSQGKGTHSGIQALEMDCYLSDDLPAFVTPSPTFSGFMDLSAQQMWQKEILALQMGIKMT